MYDNLLTTFTNIPMIMSIYLAYSNSDYMTMLCITFVMYFSFSSHLVENHKHNMTGLKRVSSRMSYFLNRMDVLGCLIVACRFCYLFNEYDPLIPFDELFLGCVGLSLNYISEIEKYDPEFKWKHYIPLHSLWHLMAARSMYVYLDIIYSS